jgi:ankyrin repeat protein
MDIHEAAKQNNIDAIKSAISRGSNIHALNEDGSTPLCVAAQHEQTEACKYLIAQGAGSELQRPNILEVAVKGGHADVVAVLWPNCNAAREYLALETAISLGFHEIADFLLENGGFRYCETDCVEKGGFPERPSSAFQQWERFFFVRHKQKLPMDRVYLDYALLLAAKAERNTGLRLSDYLLREYLVDANSQIKINADLETPLTAAAEYGNLDILELLISHPNTNFTICGKFKWPAFLHLLANSHAMSLQRGHDLARRLSFEIPSNEFFTGVVNMSMETAFSNLLRLNDSDLVKRVISLVRGAVGLLILPLLIRAHEVDGMKWMLNSRAMWASQPPPSLWVLLCRYFEDHEDQDALNLFISVASFLVDQNIWNRLILKCLHLRIFSFVQQFFYRAEVAGPPTQVTAATLNELPVALADHSLMEEWTSQNFANRTLWNAVHYDLWTNPNFQKLLGCIPNLDRPDPLPIRRRLHFPTYQNISHAFLSDIGSEEALMNDASTGPVDRLRQEPYPSLKDYQGQVMALEQSNKRRLIMARQEQERFQESPVNDAPSLPANPCQEFNDRVRQDYQMQLMLLERQNKRRLLMARQEGGFHTPENPLHPRGVIAWAIFKGNSPLLDTLLLSGKINLKTQDSKGRNPLMYAIGARQTSIVKRLLEHGDIDLNLRDNEGNSAIFYAVEGELLDIVRLLMETQLVDLSVRNNKGQTVQDFAKKGKKDKEIIAALTG